MTELSRRSLLQLSAGLVTSAAASTLQNNAEASPLGWNPVVMPATSYPTKVPQPKPERLFIKNQRTGEVFNDVVRKGTFVFEDAYAELDHLMRDWRRDEVIPIDRGLIDLLLSVQHEIGHQKPIIVISAYRSQTTNDMLRRRMRKVAKNSYHIRGMAVDFRVEGIEAGALQQVAIHQKVGGVGYYPGRGFVHLDTGPVRQWVG